MLRRRSGEHQTSQEEHINPETVLHSIDSPRRGFLFRPTRWAGRLRTKSNRAFTPDWVDEAFSLAGLEEGVEKEGEA